jgi:hypothetical protein
MLSSGINKTISSYTSSSVLLSGGPYLYQSQGGTQLCCDGAGFLYLSYTGSNYFKINPVTGTTIDGLATAYTVNSISVTKDGVVFFASGTSVYAVGGTYGSTPVLLFSPNGGSGVWLQTLAVNSTGTAVYCYDATFGSRYLCKYTAWSGGSATRTVISTNDAGTYQYGTIALTDGGMVATGYGGLTGAPAYLQWCGPISALDNTYIPSNPGIPISYGLAIDSDMSPIYVCGGARTTQPPNNVAATLLRFLPGVRSSGISIPITAWGPYGLAIHPYTRAIYVLAVGLTSRTSFNLYVITLTPQY